MNKIIETKGYEKWFSSLTEREQAQVLARLYRIALEHHFGDSKSLGKGLYAFKMKKWLESVFYKNSK